MNSLTLALMKLEARTQYEAILSSFAKDMINGNKPSSVAQLDVNRQPIPADVPTANLLPGPGGQSGVVPPAE